MVFSTAAAVASFHSFLSCAAVFAAFMPPVAREVLPPVEPVFSTTMMFSTPRSAACSAAVMPAPPAPTMTMSQSVSSTVTFSASIRPAAIMASSVAALTALVVTVAPEMPSMPAPCASTICAAKVPSWQASRPPKPGVSLSPVTTASVILPSSTVRATVTGPMPLSSPVKVSADAPAITLVSISTERRMDASFFMVECTSFLQVGLYCILL